MDQLSGAHGFSPCCKVLKINTVSYGSAVFRFLPGMDETKPGYHFTAASFQILEIDFKYNILVRVAEPKGGMKDRETLANIQCGPGQPDVVGDVPDDCRGVG